MLIVIPVQVCVHALVCFVDVLCLCLQACDIFTCMHGSVQQTGLDSSGAPTFMCACEENWAGAE